MKMRSSSTCITVSVVCSLALVLLATAAAQGKPDKTQVVLRGNKLELRIDGEKVVLKAKDLPPKGVFFAEEHPMAGGLIAVHIVGKEGDASGVELVAVKRPGNRRLELVWRGDPTPKGDLGERTHQEARFFDLTGDGLPEIVVGTVYEPARICSSPRPPLLFRRVYDPEGKKLRFVSAGRPGLDEPTEIVGAVQDGERRTIFDIVNPTCVSHSIGDGNQTFLLSPPATMVDGDGGTYWIPGNGSGAGEFAGFDVSAKVYGLSEIGLTRAEGKSLDKVESVLLATEGGLFRLVFPKDVPAGKTVWFQMGSSVKTGCMTVIIEKTRDPAGGRSAGLAELRAVSEIEGPNGPSILAGDLSSNERGEAAASLLRKLGADCVHPVLAAWPGLSSSGKRRGVRLLAENAPAAAVDILVESAVSEDDVLAKSALVGLGKVPSEAVKGLSVLLKDEDNEVFRRAVKAIEQLGGVPSVEALAESCGKGDRGRRKLLRSSLTRLAARDEKLAAVLAESLAKAEDTELVMDLLRVGAAVPSLSKESAVRAVSIFEKSETFDDRYRALKVLVASSMEGQKELLIAAAADPDEQVRALAFRGLISTARSDGEWGQVCRALEDDSAVVRTSALQEISGSNRPSGCVDVLQKSALGDPWPEIRAEALTLLVEEIGEKSATFVAKAALDKSPLVRVAAVEAAGVLPGEKMEGVVLGALSAEEKDFRVIRAAVFAAGRRCDQEFVEPLEEVLERGADPLAGSQKIELGVAAATALGFIGGEAAAQALEDGSRMANPTVERAVKKALEATEFKCSAPGKKKEGKEE